MEFKTFQDYIPQLEKEFPELTKNEITNIVKVGLQNLQRSTVKGCPYKYYSTKSKFGLFIGVLPNFKSPKFIQQYLKGLKKVYTNLYYRYEIPWDNYYYFSVPHKLNLNSTFSEKVTLYKDLEAAEFTTLKDVYIYRLYSNQSFGFSWSVNVTNQMKIEFVKHRTKRNIFNLMISNNNYKPFTVKKKKNKTYGNYKYLLERVSNGLKSDTNPK